MENTPDSVHTHGPDPLGTMAIACLFDTHHEGHRAKEGSGRDY